MIDTETGQILLQQIIANPDEDAPRAMFADWLQDRDDAVSQWYGQFIAEQLSGRRELTTMWPGTVLGLASLELPRYRLQVYSHAGLMGAVTYGGGSTMHTEGTLTATDPTFSVERGFVFHAELTCSEFMKVVGPLFARHPIVDIRLRDRKPLAVPYGMVGRSTARMEYSFSRFKGPPDDILDHWRLPLPLFTCLDKFDPKLNQGLGRNLDTDAVRIYSHEESAVSDLAFACLTCGRRAAADWLLTNRP